VGYGFLCLGLIKFTLRKSARWKGRRDGELSVFCEFCVGFRCVISPRALNVGYICSCCMVQSQVSLVLNSAESNYFRTSCRIKCYF
jgi:hypothetical protein